MTIAKRYIWVLLGWSMQLGVASTPVGVLGVDTGTADAFVEWIPREQAYAHGGEQLSVLHFTHHPIGFVCTSERCYE